MVAPMSKTKTREQLAATAYHEAGHVVVAVWLNIWLRRKAATIIPDSTEGFDGMVWTQWSFRGRPDVEITDRMYVRLERHIVVSLAGEHAQRKYRPSSVRSRHGDSDRQDAVDILSHLVPNMSSNEFTLHYRLLNERAKNLVEAHWPQIIAVANALLERKTLTEQEVREVMFPEVSYGI
jgi:hypothetical protein